MPHFEAQLSTVRQKTGQGADRDKDFYLEEKKSKQKLEHFNSGKRRFLRNSKRFPPTYFCPLPQFWRESVFRSRFKNAISSESIKRFFLEIGFRNSVLEELDLVLVNPPEPVPFTR